ncbi:MAG: hypothetical protein RIR51_1917 [Bacteroidota bacterium]|jgi:chromosomal replication initiator protein
MSELKNSIWNTCLEVIRKEVSEQTYSTWFVPIKPLKFENQTITIQVPSRFFYEWLEENYVDVLRRAIDQSIGRQGMLEYSLPVQEVEFEKEKKPQVPIANPGVKPVINHEIDSNLNSRYLFSNFIEGDCNRLGRAAGLAVANKPGQTSFNPLMIYGGVGLGKTHLIQAIGNEVKKKNKNFKVLYVSTENFTNQFVNSIRNNSIEAFTSFYLNIDTLIIDDVQFLSGKEKTQEIFFNIFNHLHQTGKQIILSSDRPPKDLVGLEDRLLSRFKWGLTADLQHPDYETRKVILERKTKSEGIDISKDIIEYIAKNVDTNVRELEGVIISIIANATLTNAEIDLDLAKMTLENIIERKEKQLNQESILNEVARYFGVEKEKILSKCRKKEHVHPRQVAMFLIKDLTNTPLKNIGEYFGGRDHSTVIHSIQTITDELEKNKSTEKNLKKLIENLIGAN